MDRKNGHDEMSLRAAKWRQCRWRHEIMSPEYERRLTAHIAAWRPAIDRRARFLAGDNDQLFDELVQRAMIALWTLGVERLDTEGDWYVWRVLRNEMLLEMRNEVYGLLRNGERLLAG